MIKLLFIGFSLFLQQLVAGIIAPEDVSFPTQLVTLKEGEANSKANAETINKAIEELPEKGGVIEVGRGQFIISEAILKPKGRSNITIRGQGGRSGGGGIGGAVHEAATVITFKGALAAGSRVWDMRATYSCGFENIHLLVAEAGAGEVTIIDWGSAQIPWTLNTTTESTGVVEVAKEIWGMRLDKSNSGVFANHVTKGCQWGVIGRLEVANESVAHTWIGGLYVGQQNGHILNGHANWTFVGTVFEPLFNRKGEETGVGTWVQLANFPAKAINFIGCWAAGKKEVGTNFGFEGAGLYFSGGTLGSAETALLIKKGSKKVRVDCEIVKAKKGVVAEAEVTDVDTTKTTFVEVTTATEGTGIEKLTEPGAPKIKEAKVAGFALETEAELKALVEAVQGIVKTLKRFGLST